MKNNLRFIIILAALGIIFGCASSALAQTEQITGGYGTADVNDKDVIAAANYAVKKQAKKQGVKIKLVSINKAEVQVVAGLNYQLCLNVEIKEKGKKTYAAKITQTVVYKNLKQKLSLTSWKESSCAEPTAKIIEKQAVFLAFRYKISD